MKNEKETETVIETTKKTTAEKKPVEKKPVIKTGKVVDCSKLNVRKDPSTDADVVTVIDNGTEVKVLETVKDFVKVEIDSVTGYCVKKYISC